MRDARRPSPLPVNLGFAGRPAVRYKTPKIPRPISDAPEVPMHDDPHVSQREGQADQDRSADDERLVARVREGYAAMARSGIDGDSTGVRAVAEAFGYGAAELDSIPVEANLGLSCGNPTATAGLRPGETVVDLGCGGGLDILLSLPKVGPTGRAIGIDMTPEMLAKAAANAVKFGGGTTPPNVEFRLGRIERLPLEDGTVDCLISNCVINLAPDKNAVFREMFRVLKPGGRVAVSDIVLKRPLPPELQDRAEAYIGCIAGAITAHEYETGLQAAGFAAIVVTDTGADLNAYAEAGAAGCCQESACCPPPEPPPAKVGFPGFSGLQVLGAVPPPAMNVHEGLAELFRRIDINDYAASARIYALKAGAPGAAGIQAE